MSGADVATSSARVEFDGELMALRADLVAMTAAAAGAIMVATEALMQSGGASTEGADSVERACARIVELQGPVERRTGHCWPGNSRWPATCGC